MPRNDQQEKQPSAKKKAWRPAAVRTVDMYVTLNCVSTGCPGGLVCDTGSGQCVPDNG